MPHTFLTRDISDSVKSEIDKKLGGGMPIRGAGGPRQGWSKALFSIGALDTEWSVLAYEIWQRALQIAASRGDDDLRSENAIRQKFEQEWREFLASEGSPHIEIVINRVSNLIYYSVQIFAKDGDISEFQQRCSIVCERAHLPVLVALSIAAAKFRHRARRAASGLKKDVPAEYRDMQQILATLKIAPKSS